VVGVAASLALVGLIVRMPTAFWLATRHGPVSVGFVWRAVAPPLSAAVLVALAVGALRQVEPSPTAGALALTAAVGLSTAILMLLAWPEIRREVRQLLTRRVVAV
jgi:PST family polysaccharide transporter